MKRPVLDAMQLAHEGPSLLNFSCLRSCVLRLMNRDVPLRPNLLCPTVARDYIFKVPSHICIMFSTYHEEIQAQVLMLTCIWEARLLYCSRLSRLLVQTQHYSIAVLYCIDPTGNGFETGSTFVHTR